MMERARRVAFAAETTAALGFVGAQVLVQPGPPCGEARACTGSTCARICHPAGFAVGFRNGGGGCGGYL
jgi:hypothetical protein